MPASPLFTSIIHLPLSRSTGQLRKRDKTFLGAYPVHQQLIRVRTLGSIQLVKTIRNEFPWVIDVYSLLHPNVIQKKNTDGEIKQHILTIYVFIFSLC